MYSHSTTFRLCTARITPTLLDFYSMLCQQILYFCRFSLSSSHLYPLFLNTWQIISFNQAFFFFAFYLPKVLLRLKRGYIYALPSGYYLMASLCIAFCSALLSRLAIASWPEGSFERDKRLIVPMLYYFLHYLQAEIYHWVPEESPITYRQLILIFPNSRS
jgi:hypothetical protein